MHFALSIAVAFLASTFVQSAPTAALDAATFLKNGQDAQKLNAQFGGIKATDACSAEEMACINNAIAKCLNGKWDTTTGVCSKTQQCFAIPNVKAAGTNLTCTSEKSALSLINASGATGGITAAEGSGSSTTSTGPIPSSTASDGLEKECTSTLSSVASSTSTPATTTATASDSPSPGPVTVTVTLLPSTVSATTVTLSPDQASSILSSILAQGQPTSSSSSSLPSSSATASAASEVITPSTSASVTPSTIILLTAAQGTETVVPEATTTTAQTASATPATVILLTAAQITETAVASTATGESAPAADPAVGYGEYGAYKIRDSYDDLNLIKEFS